ncbi:MAG: glycosyltransferase family 9 protein [Candidatus Adiutrix sp.]|jgi:ADP-heptose:LPS heptosyltransferase|nr:glycosyltransferase family 9 protein [Candidatus Adiutrix sp.]
MTFPSPTAAPPPTETGSVLFFQLKHIGDFLMTLPALGLWRQTRPHDRLGLAAAPAVAELARRHPWVDEVYIVDRAKSWRENFRLARAIAREQYGQALIFDGQTRSIVTAALAGIPQRLGASGLYALGQASPLFTRDIDLGRDLRLASQAWRSQKMAALALGREPGPPLRPIAPTLAPEHYAQADRLIAELEGDGPVIGLTLAGRQPEKSWPLASFAELARRLFTEKRARLFVTGGPAESAAAQALAQAARVPVADFCGRTDLMAVIALAERSRLFITIDTGTSHLAALTETPLISLFIWTSPAQWPPPSPHARLLCYDWALKRFGLRPGEGSWKSAPIITPDIVFDEAAAILEHQRRA